VTLMISDMITDGNRTGEAFSFVLCTSSKLRRFWVARFVIVVGVCGSLYGMTFAGEHGSITLNLE